MLEYEHIIDAYWTPYVNILVIQCRCGHLIRHRADRWKVKCPHCGNETNLQILREVTDGKSVE